MALTYGGSIWNTTAGDKTVTLTPAVGDLLVVICGNSGRTAAQPPTVSCNVQGITFSRFTGTNSTYTKNSSADSGWVFVSDSLCTAASSTIVTVTQSGDSGGGLAVYRISGMSRAGTAAIRQCGKQDNASAGTPSITMASAILTGNAVMGWVHNGTNGSTTTAPPTSWAENVDSGYNTPANGRETCSRSSGETLTTIAWTGASASAFGSILVEVDMSAVTAPPPCPVMQGPYPQVLPQ